MDKDTFAEFLTKHKKSPLIPAFLLACGIQSTPNVKAFDQDGWKEWVRDNVTRNDGIHCPLGPVRSDEDEEEDEEEDVREDEERLAEFLENCPVYEEEFEVECTFTTDETESFYWDREDTYYDRFFEHALADLVDADGEPDMARIEELVRDFVISFSAEEIPDEEGDMDTWNEEIENTDFLASEHDVATQIRDAAEEAIDNIMENLL